MTSERGSSDEREFNRELARLTTWLMDDLEYSADQRANIADLFLEQLTDTSPASYRYNRLSAFYQAASTPPPDPASLEQSVR